MMIRNAKHSEHAKVCAVAKQHKFTKDFSNMIFSGKECYEEGRIRVAVTNKVIVGLTCFRKRKRDGVTVLYFIAVATNTEKKGVGKSLMADLERRAGGVVELKVNKLNPAVGFYRKLGYREAGEAYNGEGLVFTKGIAPNAGGGASGAPGQRK